MNLKPLVCRLWLYLRTQTADCNDCSSSTGCRGDELRKRLEELRQVLEAPRGEDSADTIS